MTSEGNDWVTVELGQDVSLPFSFRAPIVPAADSLVFLNRRVKRAAWPFSAKRCEFGGEVDRATKNWLLK